MEYAKVDENLPTGPKMMLIPRADRRACLGLLVAAYCYCSQHHTDGFIPPGFLESDEDERLASLLVQVRLFDAASNGYQVHDFLDYNRSRVEIEEMKQARKIAGQKGGVRSGEARAKQMRSKCLDSASSKTNPDTDTDTSTKDTSSSKRDDGAFDEFWKQYPRKVGKEAAKKAWKKALRLTDADTIMQAVKSYPFDTKDGGKFIPHPATWLNQGRWEDDVVPFAPDPGEYDYIADVMRDL